MITVTYSDGQVKEYIDITEAKEEILETVTGCDFAITVDNITDVDGDLYITWDLTINEC